jgi:hypothetical protein
MDAKVILIAIASGPVLLVKTRVPLVITGKLPIPIKHQLVCLAG